MTTYQRIKKENANLRHALYTLCSNPDSEEATIIKMHYKLLADTERMIWQGNLTTYDPTTQQHPPQH